MIQKITLFILCLCISNIALAQTFNDGGLYYGITSSSSVTVIERATGNLNINIIIPDTASNGTTIYDVTSIEDFAFSSNGLTSVTIGDSVTNIGSQAFFNNNLTSVTIGNSVTSIESEAFLLNNLTSVTIPNSVTSIGSSVFGFANPTTSGTGEHSVTFLGTIPPAISTGFFSDNFINSSNNQPNRDDITVTVPSCSLTTYTGDTNYTGFFDITATPLAFNDGNLNYTIDCSTNTATVTGRATGNTSAAITIPDTASDGTTTYDVTSIGDTAFESNSLTNVTIGNNITSIGINAFRDNQLTSVTIPDSVTSIGINAFIDNQLTSVTIGNSVTSIGDRAFLQNQLTSVTIPDSVTSIGEAVFAINALTSVTIGNGVTSIGFQAFSSNQLTSVTIGNSVTSIGQAAFLDNDLTSVTIGNSVTNIEPAAFSFATPTTASTGEHSVTFLGMTPPAIFADSFVNSSNLPNRDDITVTVPCASLTAYTGDANYTGFFDITATPLSFNDGNLNYTIDCSTNTATVIGRFDTTVTDITIPDTASDGATTYDVTTIESQAFSFNNLTSVTIGNNVTSIGDLAFSNNQLTSATIGNSVTSIGANTFFNNQLTSVTIGNSVTSIGIGAFEFAIPSAANTGEHSVTFLGMTPPAILANSFVEGLSSNRDDITVTVPCGALTAYTDDPDYTGFFDIIPDSIIEDATFSYTATSFCNGDTALQIPTITGVSGGNFTVVPATGLVVNPATGEFDPSISTVGAYDITYTTPGAPGICPGTETVSITIATSIPFNTGDLNYTLDCSTNTVTVTGRATGNTSTDIIIPDTVTNGTITYDVTSIGNNAFRDSQLTNVTIPDSCLLYTSPSPRDKRQSRMPSSA